MDHHNEQSNILIVEDDEHINNIIYDALSKEQYKCTQAYSGSEGKLLATRHPYRLILLDLMLPGLSGEELMRYLREEACLDVPVIVLSAKDQLDHKLQLFDLGAVDYMTKPFEVKELLARVQVHISRYVRADPNPEVYRHKNLVLDCYARSVQVHDVELNLTRQEFRILELLLKHPSRVFTKRDLYELAWEDAYIGEDKTVTVHISNIRNKIRKYDELPYIDTVWGIGFRLSP
ncbi:response regulator transcription factor [Paenibacillaceae bacterium WGS1546]|uniref:response regulator transcription factor n=1 Tax=Cohnella sp. WGS1546 TaxID=3366810 RepID=UPI00372D084D